MKEDEKVTVCTFSKTRSELTDVINRVYYANEKIVISKNGRNMAVIIPVGDFEKLQLLKNVENLEGDCLESAINDTPEEKGENETLETEVNTMELTKSK